MDETIDLKSIIRTIPDFPKPGIQFRDITTLMKNGPAFRAALDGMQQWLDGREIRKVAGIEARGFVFGAALADRLGAGFVPVRKKGKLPAKTIHISYELEYGSDQLELHEDAVAPGEAVVIVDDLLATGGTARATFELLRRFDADVVGAAFLVELPDLGGRDKLGDLKTWSLVQYEGD